MHPVCSRRAQGYLFWEALEGTGEGGAISTHDNVLSYSLESYARFNGDRNLLWTKSEWVLWRSGQSTEIQHSRFEYNKARERPRALVCCVPTAGLLALARLLSVSLEAFAEPVHRVLSPCTVGWRHLQLSREDRYANLCVPAQRSSHCALAPPPCMPHARLATAPLAAVAEPVLTTCTERRRYLRQSPRQ